MDTAIRTFNFLSNGLNILFNPNLYKFVPWFEWKVAMFLDWEFSKKLIGKDPAKGSCKCIMSGL